LVAFARIGQDLEQLQTFGEVRERFRMSRALDGTLARPLPISHSLFPETRLRVMMRRQLRLALGNLSKLCRQYLGNALMVLLARAFQERWIGGVLDESMLEDILAVRR
jgi:hypothetical protein